MRSHANRAITGLLLSAAVVLAGCTNDETGEDPVSGIADLLLTVDEVPGASSAQDVEELVSLSGCQPLSRGEGRLGVQSAEHAVREYTVDTSLGESTVVTAVYEGIDTATQDAMIFRDIEQGLEVCTRDSPLERGSLVESMSTMDGLPESAVGYSSKITENGTPEAVERVYARVDGRVVVVGARHVGGDETGVDIRELLDAAITKVEGASRSVGS